MKAPLAITSGEPSGIGPELCVQLAMRGELGLATVIGDPALLAERARMLGLPLRIREGASPEAPLPAGEMHVTPLRLHAPSRPGVLDVANAPAVLEMLDVAIDGCTTGSFSGMVTAPISKAVINDAGVAFSGHTEYLALRTHTHDVVMMLAAGGLRVALATTHLPLRAVADAISTEGLRTTLRILDHDLRTRFRIAAPRIAVLGLNPHAGESGHLGREEQDIITPVIERLRADGLDLRGPLPADTAFTPRVLADVDAILAMYHDQGLPVLKYAGFGEAVNVTLGLPIVRTSVDHGTALDLAGTGLADPGSLRAAIVMAGELAGH